MDLIACLKQWTIFGPIDNPGAYPGQLGWPQWPLDGAAANEIQPRKPYRYLPSHPFLAFHVSQQTATYTFGTNPLYALLDGIAR